MTNTDDLIANLSATGAVPDRTPYLRFAGWLIAALALCGVGVAALLDGAFASVAVDGTGPLFVKWGFSVSLLLLAPVALYVQGRPGQKTGWSLAALAGPFALAAVLFVLSALTTPQVFPGSTWQQCLTAMAIMSPIAFAGAILAERQFAPTRPRRAGLAAGLFGGAVAMAAYSPYCPERGMLYLWVFYCLPILSMATIGWMVGPRLLRW